MGLRIALELTQWGQKDRHDIISTPPYGKFENGRWQKNTKQNINNIVAEQPQPVQDLM